MMILPAEPAPQPEVYIDLSQIFIAREQQLDNFTTRLERWHKLLQTYQSDADKQHQQSLTRPSPNHRIEGLIVLVYGRGGFGKSTLLRHFHDIAASHLDRAFKPSKIIDWHYDLSDKERSLLNRPPGEEVDGEAYFGLLVSHLAMALDKNPADFKEYRRAVEAVKKARAAGDSQLESLRKDERFGWAATLGGEIIKMGLRAGSAGALPEKTLAKAGEAGAKATQFGATQLKQVRDYLHDKLTTGLGDYLEPELRLGRDIGRDLAGLAKGFPLLVFFDTYEVADEADHLLQIVMGTAGRRVGWVIAGRDNLWTSQGERSERRGEPSYKDLTLADRSLAINFDTEDEGNFSPAELGRYFEELRRLDPSLPTVEEEDLLKLWEVSRGVPLAVSIAAGLYLEKRDLVAVTEGVDSREDIVKQMVERYLLHTNSYPSDLYKLYGLALLRRVEKAGSLAVALGLAGDGAEAETEAERERECAGELRRLHRRYSFIFTAREPALHQEVRHFLRLWLMRERRHDPALVEISRKLAAKHRSDLAALEERGDFKSLRERLETERWVDLYVDLMEQKMWLDPDEGLGYALPLMVAASVYRRGANQEIAVLCRFFEGELTQPQRRYWEWAEVSLVYQNSREPSPEALQGLEELVSLARQRGIDFHSGLKLSGGGLRSELEGVLWWRRAEACEGGIWWRLAKIVGIPKESKAVEWYEKALAQLGEDQELCEATAEAVYDLALGLYDQNEYEEAVTHLNRVLELKPDYVAAFHKRGDAYNYLKEYDKSLADYNRAIELEPKLADAFTNRGQVYEALREYDKSLADYNRAIELEPNNKFTFIHRGHAYSTLKEYEKALADYNRAIELGPNDADTFTDRGLVYYLLKEYDKALADYTKIIELEPKSSLPFIGRGHVYLSMKKYEKSLSDFSQAVELEPNFALAFIVRGNFYQNLKEYQQALADYNRAIELEPNESVGYSNRGICYLWLVKGEQARADFERAWQLNKNSLFSGWMAEWTGLNNQRLANFILAERLNTLAEIKLGSYVALVCEGVALGLAGKLKEGLDSLDEAITLKPEEGDAYFWKGMTLAYLGRPSQMLEALDLALKVGLPPVLLAPLEWLKQDRPDFYREHIRPWLDRLKATGT